MKSFALEDRAFTGLEAAMVFIAFIVVASIFAYMALGAGFFTTQKTQDTVYSAVKHVDSTVQIVEPIMVQAGADGQHLRCIVITVKIPQGDADIDVEQIVVTVSTAETMRTYAGAIRWRPIDGDRRAERSIFWQVQIPLLQADDPTIPEELLIGRDQRFFVELKSSDIVPFAVECTAPANLNPGRWHEI